MVNKPDENARCVALFRMKKRRGRLLIRRRLLARVTVEVLKDLWVSGHLPC